MAKLVELIGITHSPPYVTRFRDPNEKNPGILRAKEAVHEMQERMARARPDVLVCLGNDHLSQVFMNNMPAFMVVKAERVAGPWKWEQDTGIPSYEAKVEVGLAKGIVRSGFDHGVDFAFSDEYKLDHAFCVPLSFVRPEADLPIVPIFCNVMAPPIPPARRFFEVGTQLRQIIAEYPEDLRVGVVCTGHLSLEIGGPTGSGNSAPDPEFDDAAVDNIGRGDVDGVIKEFTPERMMRAGNYTAGVLNFVALMGLAEARPADHAECVHSDILSVPFFAWDLDGGKQ